MVIVLVLTEFFDLHSLFFIFLFIFSLTIIFKIARCFCILSCHLNVFKDVWVVFLDFIKSHFSIVQLKVLLVFYWSLFKSVVNLSQTKEHKNQRNDQLDKKTDY